MAVLSDIAPLFRTAMFTTASALWAADASPVLVTYGMPAFDIYDDVVSLGAMTGNQAEATMGTNRSREDTVTLEVIFYCFRNGGQEQELITQTRAWALLAGIENSIRVTDPTMGVPSIRQVQFTDFSSADATDQAVLSKGRMHVISATFTASARITTF